MVSSSARFPPEVHPARPMAVVIRLKRTGRRNRPCYRISVAESRNPRDGRTLETLGMYDPVTAGAQSGETVPGGETLNVERARHWLSRGARPSATVHSIFKRHSVYEGELSLDEAGKAVRKRNTRPGRKTATKTRARKRAAKKSRAEAKSARRTERLAARSAAKKAEKAAAAAEGQES